MEITVDQQYTLQSSDFAATDLALIEEELKRLARDHSIQEEAMSHGISTSHLAELEFNVRVDEEPAISPGELATLAITIVILAPTGQLVKTALLDVWEHVLFPRLLDWIDAKRWTIEPTDVEEGTSSPATSNTKRRTIMTEITSINPSTGEKIATHQTASTNEVASAVVRAREAQASWKTTPPEERIMLFAKLGEVIEAQVDEIVSLIHEETGKRVPDAEYEPYDIMDGIGHYSRQLKLLMAKDLAVPPSFLPHGTKFNTIAELRLEPHGVVAAIMPWNFPFWIPMVNIIPSMLAGNTVVFKPSEYSTLVGKKIAELFREAGFPEGVLELVVGADEVGKALVTSGIDFVFLTGSVEAGLDARRNVGLKPVEFELGGNSASIILEDADIDLAVEGTVWGGVYNAGQSCSGHKRVYVHEAIADEFKRRVLEKVNSLVPVRDYGPYIRQSQLEEVDRRVQDAVRQGAKLLTGGQPPKNLPKEYEGGFWYAPTVLEYADDALSLVSKETFGNVLPIRVVGSTDQAIKLANATDYGLNNILWSQNLEEAEKLAGQLQSGMVFINEAELALVAGEYWGGWKNSGIGSIGTKLEKCFKQQLLIAHTGSKPRDYWFPYE